MGSHSVVLNHVSCVVKQMMLFHADFDDKLSHFSVKFLLISASYMEEK